MSHVTDWLLGLHGWVVLLVVFALPALESSAFVGFLFPGEIAVLLGGVLAFEHRAPLMAVIVAAVAGAVVGDSIGYWVGRRWGRKILNGTVGRFFKEEHIDRAQGYVATRGGKAVFFGRFTAALRVLIPGLAGMSNMHYPTFAVYNVAGGAVWATGFVLAGFAAGRGWREVEHVAGRASLLLLLIFIFIAAVVLAVRWIEAHAEQTRAFLDVQYSRPWVKGLRNQYERQLAFLMRRFHPEGALGLSLTIEILLIGAAGWALGIVGQDVAAHDDLELVDVPVDHFFIHHREPWLTTVMRTITALGSSRILLPVVIVAGVIWWARARSLRPGLVLFGSYAGALALSNVVKLLVDRPRPPAGLMLVHVTGSAFPSGHAAQSIAVYGVLAALLAGSGASWTTKVMSWSAALLLSGIIGVSRLYLGAHWLTDVLAGWALGALWLFALVTALRTRDRLKGSSPQGIIAVRPTSAAS
ncbi:MAG TPA: bifunctional DedA family/phosphatase PAP2 family protein [Actinomycetota bacterium]|nr:bifunctional DedA family/phosphatase PAP2 family protein [Actinomycetota bacterium]